jgi:hypothetical protein
LGKGGANDRVHENNQVLIQTVGSHLDNWEKFQPFLLSNWLAAKHTDAEQAMAHLKIHLDRHTNSQKLCC